LLNLNVKTMTSKWASLMIFASVAVHLSTANDVIAPSIEECIVDQASSSSSQCHVHLAQLRAAALHSNQQKQEGDEQRYLLRSGDSIYLRSPSHNNDYLECHGGGGEGWGVSTVAHPDQTHNGYSTAEWQIMSTSGGTGVLTSGDSVYLRNPSHENQYLECHDSAGEGYGVSTVPGPDGTFNGISTAQWTIELTSGSGDINFGASIFLRSPSHHNQFLEAHGAGGDGFGVSTTPKMDGIHQGFSTAQWNIEATPRLVPTSAPTPAPTPEPTPAPTPSPTPGNADAEIYGDPHSRGFNSSQLGAN
jgi:hypothetical protein